MHTLFCQVNLDSWLQYLFCKILLSCVQILLWCSQISREHHFPNPHMSSRSDSSFFITKSSSSKMSWHLYTFSVIFNCVAAETQHRADRVKQTAAETLHSVSGFISAAVSVLSSQVLLTRPAGRKHTSPEGQMKLCCHLWALNGTATTMWSLFTCSCKHQCSTSCCYCLNIEVLK